MTMPPTAPLILGGHSFFSELGNDPVPSPELQREIVRACLDGGITRFDTTHQPERLALGRALKDLGRREEAAIFAWNFLKELGPEDKLDRPIPYESRHIDQLCRELQTDYIDGVVIHDLDGGSAEVHAGQESVARAWVQQGRVRTLGVWVPRADATARYGGDPAFTFMICPLNVDTPGAAATFELGKSLGWRNFACSPFVRGWTLDRMLEKAQTQEAGDRVVLRATLADRLLRYTLYHPNVDGAITAIRRLEWVQANIDSAARGPLDEQEMAWLRGLL